MKASFTKYEYFFNVSVPDYGAFIKDSLIEATNYHEFAPNNSIARMQIDPSFQEQQIGK